MSGITGCFSYVGQVNTLSTRSCCKSNNPEVSKWISQDRCFWIQYKRNLSNQQIDTSSQPIQSHCGRYVLAFSGRINNHQEIRRGLRHQIWKGNSDAETLVEGLAQRNTSLIIDLRGVFAFAFYDTETKQLLLARDRIGVKSLWWQSQESKLCFSSDVRQLFQGELNLASSCVSHYLSFGYYPIEGEFGEGIFPLSPGTLMRIGPDSSQTFLRWWPPSPRPDWTPLPIKCRRDAVTLVRQELDRTVQEHISSDIPVNCLLTRDSNSKIVAALAARHSSKQINTFSVHIQDSLLVKSDITDFTNHIGASHQEICISSQDYIEHFAEAIKTLELPSFQAAHICVIGNALKRAGVQKMMFGFPGQETLGVHLSGLVLMSQLARLRVFELWPKVMQLTNPRLFSMAEDAPRFDAWYLHLAGHRLATNSELQTANLQYVDWPKSPPCRLTQFLARVFWNELYGYVEPFLLRDIDQMERIVGIETKLPLFDHRLIELLLRIPEIFYLISWDRSLLEIACQDLFPKLTMRSRISIRDVSSPEKLMENLQFEIASLITDEVNHIPKQIFTKDRNIDCFIM
ncbi:asparagine synthetase B family protein [Acaryochloris marina NIES-2412]|uniref:asparagine synthetase B family protein n=1 Tax=Acaryochloris marina TaxID=155978 RepID=UPI004057EDD2